MIFILLGTLLYFITGFISARVMRPAMISASTYHEGDQYWEDNIYGDDRHKGNWGRWVAYTETTIDREEVMSATRNMIFGWPVMLPILAVSYDVNKAIDKVDPEVYARAQEKIKSLESEAEDFRRELERR